MTTLSNSNRGTGFLQDIYYTCVFHSVCWLCVPVQVWWKHISTKDITCSSQYKWKGERSAKSLSNYMAIHDLTNMFCSTSSHFIGYKHLTQQSHAAGDNNDTNSVDRTWSKDLGQEKYCFLLFMWLGYHETVHLKWDVLSVLPMWGHGAVTLLGRKI